LDDDALPQPLTSADTGDGCTEARFEDWYRDHYDRLRGLCARILSDPSAAEDIAQETLLRAWLGKDRMREQDVGAWLSVVARNLCVSHMRRRWRTVPHDILPDAPDYDADPAFEAERSETRRSVRHALSQVGDRHRRLLVRREVGGADYAELGEELGLTASGARAVLFRARRSLKDRLAAVGEGLGAWVAGVRIRLNSTATRLREAARPIEAGGVNALQAGMSLALASGIALSSGFAGGQGASAFDVSLPSRSSSALVGGVDGGNGADPSFVAPGSETSAISVPGSPGKGRIRSSYDPSDGSSSQTIILPGGNTKELNQGYKNRNDQTPCASCPWIDGARWLECKVGESIGVCSIGKGDS
jgi:RNA polymerase sigma-70 factor (ECF subfamily)